MNTKKMGFEELNMEECRSVDGGRRIPWKKIREFGSKVLEWAGYYDAVDSFVEGWNSVDC